MASKSSSHIKAFAKQLKEEWENSAHRKHPDQAFAALKDERVRDAIEKRFDEKMAIKGVRQLDYDFYSGLINLVFEFHPSLDALVPAIGNAFLVILDSRCKVVGLVDPFDPVQPNKYVPPLPDGIRSATDGEQPFVLDRPRAQIVASHEQMHPLLVRSHAFMERIKGGGWGPIIIEIETRTQYTTWTPVGYMFDWLVDDDSGPIVIDW